MFQCLGLATEQDGGCGEDWWHPECLLGLPRDWHITLDANRPRTEKASEEISQEVQADEGDDEHPVPPGFPTEEDFDTLICYKCVNANPWMRIYARSKGFTSLEYKGKDAPRPTKLEQINGDLTAQRDFAETVSNKRKAEDSIESEDISAPLKKPKLSEANGEVSLARHLAEEEKDTLATPIHSSLSPPLPGTYSLLGLEDFRSAFCRCVQCHPHLDKHPQLAEEEELYEPPISEDGDGQGGSVGTGSLLERGEAALSNVDRVRAIGKKSHHSLAAWLTISIEGVMAYNHMKDKLKSFLQPFAESGQAVGAEDIKSYFEKLRGDNEAIKEARAVAAAGGGDGPDGDNRREQSGE